MAHDRPCAKLNELLVFFLMADRAPANVTPQDDDENGGLADLPRVVARPTVSPLLWARKVIA
ncbi:MAG: hypothetical protein CMF72_19565 [Mameliella sp.]|nr:hypothetical protein [Mameliella sp.]|tara:strand:+ start:693 stop:878 length:186 start_codon:yes stop_codon:yes gene_type:complete